MERNKKIIIASVIVSVMVLFIGIAFAALASNLNVEFGNVTQNALTWNVGFKGDSSTPTQEGTSNTGLACGTASVTPSTVTISDSTLSKPGDKCTYPLVIENNGNIAANLSNIVATEPTSTSCTITNGSTMICGNITYQLQTTSGGALTTGITINRSEAYNIKLVASYTGDSLNSSVVQQSNAKFTLTYTQSEKRATSAPEGVTKKIVCKRATTLHTENCSRTRDGCYATGYTTSGSKGTTIITYGSFGTSGILTSGDAFDCDVNGDGKYDSTTERFYYISGLDGNDSSDYAVLIYYTNVQDGIPSYSATSRYSTSGNSYDGPTAGYLHLPTTSQWSNVRLSNNTRQTYTETGAITIDETTMDYDTYEEVVVATHDMTKFTYTDRAARLLSYKEINKACNMTLGSHLGSSVFGELDDCYYLLEKTGYANNDYVRYWTETAESDSINCVWYINGENRYIGQWMGAFNTLGIRPVIEVLKDEIEY